MGWDKSRVGLCKLWRMGEGTEPQEGGGELLTNLAKVTTSGPSPAQSDSNSSHREARCR